MDRPQRGELGLRYPSFHGEGCGKKGYAMIFAAFSMGRGGVPYSTLRLLWPRKGSMSNRGKSTQGRAGRYIRQPAGSRAFFMPRCRPSRRWRSPGSCRSCSRKQTTSAAGWMAHWSRYQTRISPFSCTSGKKRCFPARSRAGKARCRTFSLPRREFTTRKRQRT